MYKVLDDEANLIFLKDYNKHFKGERIIGEMWLDVERNKMVFKIDGYILVGSDMVMEITDLREHLINDLI